MNNQLKLLELAKQAAQNAYAPYSKFCVGAAILSSNGHFYAGCNVENISYPVGTCAEAGAIAAMVCGGDTKIEVILVYADSKELITPCGACRQRIKEFASPDCQIYLANSSGIQKTFALSELLPYSFSEF